jgi:hypothetical protein
MKKILFAIIALLISSHSFASLPENDLWKQDNKFMSNITEAEFYAVIDEMRQLYSPIIRGFGGWFVLSGNWDDSTVNAYASRSGSEYHVNMFGGLARRPEVTLDGFRMVICHEIGHHLGGFPNAGWASYEGQSDYYATHVCARKVLSKYSADETEIPYFCEVLKTEDEQKTCARSLKAGLSLATLLATLNNEPMPSYDTFDPTVVRKTKQEHPAAQCRLDTYLAGAVCDKEWNDKVIPKNAKATCARPRCWYAP